jgi:hypothetical protein
MRPIPAPTHTDIFPTMTSTAPVPRPRSFAGLPFFPLRSLCGVVVIAAWALAGGAGCGKPSSKADKPANPLEAAALARVRAAGFPVTLEDLNDWYPEVPAAENAAVLYAEAFAAMAPVKPTDTSFLERNRSVLPKFHEAGRRTRCRYPVDCTGGMRASLPHLTKLRSAGTLLTQTAVARSRMRQPAEAVELLLDAVRLANSLEAEPILVSQLVRSGILGMVVQAAEEVVGSGGVLPEDLVRLQDALIDTEERVSELRMVAGELPFGLGIFGSTPPEMKLALENLDEGLQKEDTKLKEYVLGTKVPADRAEYVIQLDLVREMLSRGDGQRMAAIQSLREGAATAQRQGWLITPTLIPGLARGLERIIETRSRLRVAVVGIAVERHRAASQRKVPLALSGLSPEWIGALPNDPFDERPLRFKRLPAGGYIVYSIGPDQQDNGGRVRPPMAGDVPNYDVTFTVAK